MKIYLSPSSDPFYNLALEETLFNLNENIILIYINRDSVICGKHQNAVAESNSRFLHEMKVPLIRRFSGGGTVYHDKGNVNFSFITTGADSKVIDFKKYAALVRDFLRTIQIKAEITDRNDLTIDGFKITGHAAHAKNKRALHHGTLLFDSRLQYLSEGLNSNREKFVSRAVESVRSKVTNISQYLDNSLNINEFVDMLILYLSNDLGANGEIVISDSQKNSIQLLADEKYKSFEWNYGYGPDYTFSISEDTGSGYLDLKFKVSKGCFEQVEVSKNTTFDAGWKDLTGKKHYWSDMEDFFAKKEVDTEKIIDLFF